MTKHDLYKIVEKYNEQEYERYGGGYRYIRAGLRDGELTVWIGEDVSRCCSPDEYYDRPGCDVTLIDTTESCNGPSPSDGVMEWCFLSEGETPDPGDTIYYGSEDGNTSDYTTKDNYMNNPEKYPEYKPFVLVGFVNPMGPDDDQLDELVEQIEEHFGVEIED